MRKRRSLKNKIVPDMTHTEETKVAVMQEQIGYIKNQVDTIVKKLEENYVTQVEFDAMVLGYEKRISNLESNQNKLAWMIIGSVVVALIGLVVTIV
jgi:hypothetical protein